MTEKAVSPLSDAEALQLLEKAKDTMRHSYCAYSNFPVGAALLCADGTTFTGVNVESAAFGGTICAERTALCAAVAAGHRHFRAVAVVAKMAMAYPCGQCRQLMIEFGDIEVIVAKAEKLHDMTRTSLCTLLPHAFTKDSLNKARAAHV